MMSGATISWNSKKQTCVALSTTEAAQELIWLQSLLMDMNENSVDPMTIFEEPINDCNDKEPPTS